MEFTTAQRDIHSLTYQGYKYVINESTRDGRISGNVPRFAAVLAV